MFNKIKKVKLSDILGCIIFLILLIPAFIKKKCMKATGKRLWLVCEHFTARDNGYVFYKFLKEQHPEIDSYYAIKFDGDDYEKLRPLGGLIKWGSMKHYYYYMISEWNITSHKNGMPNQALFTFLQKFLKKYNNVIFLGHGVTYQNFTMWHKKNCCFRMFVCGAKDEYEFVKQKFGYGDEVKYTGLARFDQLFGNKADTDIILFIPTWRRWLSNVDKNTFMNSDYYKNIMAVLNSESLSALLQENNKTLLFYPHFGSWAYASLYTTKSNYIKVLEPEKNDIQQLLRKGSLLITDYSSVFTDFAFMEKPIIYYQNDIERYWEDHVGSNDTYFDFETDGFGPVVYSIDDMIAAVDEIIKSDMKMDVKYINRASEFFQLHDNKNCDRIFDEILQL